MKKSLSITVMLVFLLAMKATLYANMAEPVRRGSQGASPFTPKYVDILHEHIQVRINSGFTEA